MGGRAGDPGFRHDFLDGAPGGGTAEAPEPFRGAYCVTSAAMQAEIPLKIAQHVGRQRHLPDDATFAALEGLDSDRAAFAIDRSRREYEHFRNSRASPEKRQIKQAHFLLSARRGFDEAAPLGGVEIFSVA